MAAACGSADEVADTEMVEAMVTTTPFLAPVCEGRFVPHDLAHTTTPSGSVVAVVDGTGAGVLADDLDGDGRIDMVLPNLSGGATVLWNQGHLNFEDDLVTEIGRFRQAISYDIDGDARRDLLLTTGVGPAQAYFGTATGFERRELRDLEISAFSVGHGDLEGDGDVDLVTSSYAADLTMNRDLRALTGVGIGSAVYRPVGDGYEEELLSDSAQALVSQIVDIDGDGASDVIVGNDFGTPDRLWLATEFGLTFTQLFDTTTLSTMSMDVSDLDNDGDLDLVATDMKPMPGAPADVWDELAIDIEAARTDDVQEPENAVLVRGDEGYDQMASTFGLDATGWSWSGVLGDLDHDGLQDLYIVNGMQADGFLDALPDGELIEANQAFRNLDGDFEAAPSWNLASERGGRGMAMADFDDDGDLDIVVNNLGAPAQLFENRVCGGASLIVEPLWSGAQNLDALGAVVEVVADDVRQLRSINGVRGYLSTSATSAHVGLGDAASVDVRITWPDGLVTDIDDVAPGQRLVVDRREPAREDSP